MSDRGVYLITGLPATGKTTLARALARELALPLLSKDGIKEPLLDVIGAADRNASRTLSDASFAVLFALADTQLATVGALVMEGNFRPGEHESALQDLLARHAPLMCTQVLCRIPEALRRSRLEARTLDIARHPGHRDAAWVSQGDARSDTFLNLDGARLIHEVDAQDEDTTRALIRSLANRHLV